MDIAARKLAILTAIIDDYIATGVPVGSRTISKKPGVDLSSATIRNEMADLEELGYLEQPHTSAGRIPSDKAYRLYVDRLMSLPKLSEREAAIIREHLNQSVGALEQVIEQTAKVLSSMTDQISIVSAPQLDVAEVKRIQLVKLTETKVLLLIVTNTGLVRDVVLNVAPGMEARQLEMISNMLTELMYNRTVREMTQTPLAPLLGEMRDKREFMDNVLASIIENASSAGKGIVFGGTKNIFNFPEYKDVDKARNFLEVLETRSMLEKLLSRARNLEFSISIGHENEIDQLSDMSIVTATYKIGGVSVGSFGVIGPTRMDYAKIIAILNHVGGSLNEILSNYIDNE